MGVKISDVESADISLADSEQPEIFREDMLISKAASWQEALEQEEPFRKLDFEHALKKVSNKVKK